MKSTKDTYTGKRFRYTDIVTVSIDGSDYDTVALITGSGFTWLHPSRLLPSMFKQLNPNRERREVWQRRDHEAAQPVVNIYQPNDFAAPEFREIIQAMKSATKEEIATLFAADTALRRMGFPKEAQNLRGIAAIAIVMKGRK